MERKLSSFFLVFFLFLFAIHIFAVEKLWFRIGIFWRIEKEGNRSFLSVYRYHANKWGDGIFYNNSILSLKKYHTKKIEVFFRNNAIKYRNDGQAFFYFRVVNRNNYYAIRVRMNTTYTSYIEVFRCVEVSPDYRKDKTKRFRNFKFYVLHTKPIKLEQLRWYKLTILLDHNNLSAYIDDKKVIEYQADLDLNYEGKVGLAVRDGLYSFDDYVLYDVDGNKALYDDFSTFDTFRYVKVKVRKVKSSPGKNTPFEP